MYNLQEMSKNARSEASKFNRDGGNMDQLGIHIYKWLMWTPNKDAKDSLKTFLWNVLDEVYKESTSTPRFKIKSVWFNSQDILKEMDKVAGKLHSRAIRSMKNLPDKNQGLGDSDNFSMMGVSLHQYIHPAKGIMWRLYFEDQLLADTADAIE